MRAHAGGDPLGRKPMLPDTVVTIAHPTTESTIRAAVLNWLPAGTAVAGALFGLWKYREEQRLNRAQRSDELRWRQMEAGKRMLDEVLNDPEVEAAFSMLDTWSKEFEIAPGDRRVITAEGWLKALQYAADTATDPVGMFVRD